MLRIGRGLAWIVSGIGLAGALLPAPAFCAAQGGGQEGEQNYLVVEGGLSPDQGRPVLVAGADPVTFAVRSFPAGAPALPDAFDDAYSIENVTEVVSSDRAVATAARFGDFGIRVTPLSPGEVTITVRAVRRRGDGRATTVTRDVPILVVGSLTTLPVALRLLRAAKHISEAESVDVSTRRILPAGPDGTGEADTEEAQESFRQMVETELNRIWLQAGIQFNVSIGVFSPQNEDEQAVIDASFDNQGRWSPSVEWHETFNEGGVYNVYFVRANAGALERAGTSTQATVNQPPLTSSITLAYGTTYGDGTTPFIPAVLAHEIGHALGLNHVIFGPSPGPNEVGVADLDDTESVNHRRNRVALGREEYNLMRPQVDPDPLDKTPVVTSSQARHARTQLDTFPWAP